MADALTNETTPDWYERQNELEPGQVFRHRDGTFVRLDRRVAGDGTDWWVDSWSDYCGCWLAEDERIHPSDLAERLPDDWAGERPTAE